MFEKRKIVTLIRDKGADPEYRLFVGELEIGYIRGSLIVHENKKDSFFDLGWFEVKTEFRKKGYGRMLMQAVVKELLEYNKKNPENPICFLRVYPSSSELTPQECYQVYTSLGFHFINSNPDLSQKGEMMKLNLIDNDNLV